LPMPAALAMRLTVEPVVVSLRNSFDVDAVSAAVDAVVLSRRRSFAAEVVRLTTDATVATCLKFLRRILVELIASPLTGSA
jgi:hypothetical protein